MSVLGYFNKAIVWEDLEEQVGDWKKYLKGNVLNAGSGAHRGISKFVDGTVINQDIFDDPSIDIVSPIHQIPVADNHFDALFCNAVIEHVINPEECIAELYRVLKPGGHGYIAIPFLQPEHLVPTDFQRYTFDGIQELVKRAGFKVVKTEGMGNVYHTIAWILQEWIRSKKNIIHYLLRLFFYPILKYKCRTSKTYVHAIASGYRVLVTK